jgi:Mg2+ and Co2+ transporter CorA
MSIVMRKLQGINRQASANLRILREVQRAYRTINEVVVRASTLPVKTETSTSCVDVTKDVATMECEIGKCGSKKQTKRGKMKLRLSAESRRRQGRILKRLQKSLAKNGYHIGKKCEAKSEQSDTKKPLQLTLPPSRPFRSTTTKSLPSPVVRSPHAHFREHELVMHLRTAIFQCEGLRDQAQFYLTLQVTIAASRLEELAGMLTVFSTVFIPLEFISVILG